MTNGKETISGRLTGCLKNNEKMKTISLKLDDNIFRDTENLLSSVNLSRNRYINEAILYYNELQKTRQLEIALEAESKLCEQSSVEVLTEFESIDNYDF
jgi:predicted transcriptional regulator